MQKSRQPIEFEKIKSASVKMAVCENPIKSKLSENIAEGRYGKVISPADRWVKLG